MSRSKSERARRRSWDHPPGGRSAPAEGHSIPGFRLTVRHGSEVERERLDSLDEAMTALRDRAERIRSEGPLERVSMLREFDPEEQVAARLEVSTPGMFGSRDAGIDVKGDGSVVAYRGAIFKRPIVPAEGENAYDAVRAILEKD